ncbi:MAG TPA: ATP-binding protein, partial [Chloroflexota bacterium]
EQLAAKRYPIVIFDPRGDYTGLADVPELAGRVKRYYAQFPVFDEDAETAAQVVGTLGYPLKDAMLARFGDVFDAARSFYAEDRDEAVERTAWLAEKSGRDEVVRYGLKPDMYLVARMAEVGELLLRKDDDEGKRQLQEWGWSGFGNYSRTDARTLEAIKKRAFSAAKALRLMEETNQRVAATAEPLPRRRTELVDYGRISVVSLAGYSDDFRATIYGIVADEIFQARLRDELRYPALLVLEEAHNVVPASAGTAAVQRATAITKQIAQEGRKFGLGLMLISQRPSRLDATTLSQCNSFVVMRMVNPADQKFVRDVIETLGEDDVGLLPDLDVGEALLSGQFVNFPVLARVSPPASKGEREEEDAFEVLERVRRSAPPAADAPARERAQNR